MEIIIHLTTLPILTIKLLSYTKPTLGINDRQHGIVQQENYKQIVLVYKMAFAIIWLLVATKSQVNGHTLLLYKTHVSFLRYSLSIC